MPVIHHTAVCVRDLGRSLRFWRDGLGFEVLMDEEFAGDWPTLLRAATTSLHSVFLGDPGSPAAGILELVDFGDATPRPPDRSTEAVPGFLLVSVMTALDDSLDRLAALGLGGTPRRVRVSGVDMAVVVDPDGVEVEVIDAPAAGNLERLSGQDDDRAPDL